MSERATVFLNPSFNRVLSFVNLRSLRGVLIVVCALKASALAQGSYLGFDRNDYPGDANLKTLRKAFSYSGYWLNNPPGENSNTWIGKRPELEKAGFGFLVLFNARLYKQLKHNPAQLAQADAQSAVASAKREGFPARTIIFLDIEEGGRMLPEQKSYIYAWADAVIVAGFRAGVYCSGIPAREGKSTIITAEDILESAGGRDIAYWVTNDVCPPSPGCAVMNTPSPQQSGVSFADVWQFAQSPRRKDFAAMCHNYSSDGNCYEPGMNSSSHLFLDLNVANSADPSGGR